MTSLPQEIQTNSSSLAAPYDTFMALKADQSIRLPSCLNSLIQSTTTPLLEIHASISASEHLYSNSLENTGSFAPRFPEVDPKATVKQAISQLLEVLRRLDADILRPMQKLSISVKGIQHHIRSLKPGYRASTNTVELKRIREALKQSAILVRALRRKLPSFRKLLKAFIYWTDSELMATLASSIHILLRFQDSDKAVTGSHTADMEVDVRFNNLIDRCVDIVHSSWLLTCRLGRMQRQCRALIEPLESLSVQASARSSFSTNLSLAKTFGARVGGACRNGGRVGNSLGRHLTSLAQFHTIISPACSITSKNLIEQLELLC